MGFSLHEVCKIAWNSPEEYPEIKVTKPSAAKAAVSDVKAKTPAVPNGIKSVEGKAQSVD